MKKLFRLAIAAFWIGGGQIVKGNTRKGILLMLISYAIVPWGFFLCLSVSDFLSRALVFILLPLYLGLTVYGMVDAWH